jgi:outer membrane protein TolC
MRGKRFWQGIGRKALVVWTGTWMMVWGMWEACLGAEVAAYVDWPTVMRLAGAKNEEVAAARLQHHRAVLDVDQAWQRFWPTLSMGAQYRKHQGRLQDVVGDVIEVRKQQVSMGPTVQIDWSPGDSYYAALAAKQRVLAAGQMVERARLELVREAAGRYFELLAAEAVAAVWMDDLTVFEGYAGQLEQGVSAGTVYRGDLLRVRTQVARLKMQIQRAEEGLGVASARLAETLRLPPETALRPAKSDLVPMRSIREEAIGALVWRAQVTRPEVRATETKNEGLRREEERVRLGPWVPSLQAGYTAGGLGGSRGGGASQFGDQQDLYVGFGWKIGPGGLMDTTRRKAATATREAGELELARIKAVVGREVVEAAVRSRSSEAQVRLSEQAVQSAEEMTRLASERQASQVGVVLEFVLAREDLARARLERIRAISDFNRSQQELRCALGDLVGEAEYGR